MFSGKYIYLRAMRARLGSTAVIRTPWFKKSTLCVTFSYHMNGALMGGLHLYAFIKRRNNNKGKSKLLWEKHGNQNNIWHTTQVTFNPEQNTEVNIMI